MKNKTIFIGSILFIGIGLIFASCGKNKIQSKQQTDIISYYEVPLVCGAAPDIGCGSRIKPFFIDTKKEALIKESWSNRQGTVIAIVWNETASNTEDRENLIQPIFQKHGIEAILISNNNEIKELMSSFRSESKWYKEMDIDKLSLEEAGVIADDLTMFAKDSVLITEQERILIKNEIEAYFKKELVIVRNEHELTAEETRNRWHDTSFKIYVKYIGPKRTNVVSAMFEKYQAQKESCKKDKSCCDKDESKKGCHETK